MHHALTPVSCTKYLLSAWFTFDINTTTQVGINNLLFFYYTKQGINYSRLLSQGSIMYWRTCVATVSAGLTPSKPVANTSKKQLFTSLGAVSVCPIFGWNNKPAFS